MTTKTSESQMQTRAVRLERKQIRADGEFEGYGSVFGVEDSYKEVVARGAFKESLSVHKAAGTMPALLWQHDPAAPIGHYVEMYEDDKGLFVRGQLALETQKGREAQVLLKSGALNGLSIGFMPKRSERDEDSLVTTLTEIDLWECSLVTFPANARARVSGAKAMNQISGLADWKSFERYLRDEGGLSNDAATAMVAQAKRLADREREARDAKAALTDSTRRLLDILKS